MAKKNKLKSKSKLKGKRKVKIKRRTPTTIQDEELCFTKGQLCNIVDAAAKKKGACPKAKIFIKELKAEMRRNRNHA